jgi:hypothetical protein
VTANAGAGPALNQDFSRYDQVRKAHTYRLAEHESDEFDEDYEIATLDFGPFLRGDARDKARFAAEFGAALQEIGFAVLTGHGVDPALYDDMHDGVARPVHLDPARGEDALPGRAPRLGQPGLFPDRGDQRHPSRPGRRLGLVPARLRHPQDRDGPFRAEDYWPRAEYERASAASSSPTSPVQADRPGDVPGAGLRSARL